MKSTTVQLIRNISFKKIMKTAIRSRMVQLRVLLLMFNH